MFEKIWEPRMKLKISPQKKFDPLFYSNVLGHIKFVLTSWGSAKLSVMVLRLADFANNLVCCCHIFVIQKELV